MKWAILWFIIPFLGVSCSCWTPVDYRFVRFQHLDSMALRSFPDTFWKDSLWYGKQVDPEYVDKTPLADTLQEWLPDTVASPFIRLSSFSNWNHRSVYYKFGTPYAVFDSTVAWQRLQEAIRIGFMGSLGAWDGENGDLFFKVMCEDTVPPQVNGFSACLDEHTVLVTVRSGRIVSFIFVSRAGDGMQRLMRRICSTASGWEARIDLESEPTDVIVPKKYHKQEYLLRVDRSGCIELNGRCGAWYMEHANYTGW